MTLPPEGEGGGGVVVPPPLPPPVVGFFLREVPSPSLFTGARLVRLNEVIPKSQLCFSSTRREEEVGEEACLSIFLEQAARNTTAQRKPSLFMVSVFRF